MTKTPLAPSRRRTSSNGSTSTMKQTADAGPPEFMSRSEGRKVFVMLALLVVMGAYTFRGAFHKSPGPSDPLQEGVPVKPPGANPGPIGHAGPYQDARKALETLRKHEEAKRKGAPISSASFTFDPEKLQEVQDGALDVVDEPALYHLAAYVRSLSDEDVQQELETKGSWTWKQLNTETGRDAARGKFKTIQGRFLIPLWQRVLERYPNEADLAWVWQGIFRVQNRGYFVTITDKNFEPEIGLSGTIVELDAAFLKGHAYESELGVKRMPHVVARSMRKVTPPKQWDYMNSELIWGSVVAFALIGALVFAYARASSRSEKKFDEWRHKRLTGKKAGTPKAHQSKKAGSVGDAKPEGKDGPPVGGAVAAPASEASASEAATTEAGPEAATTEPEPETEAPTTEPEAEAPTTEAEPEAATTETEPEAPTTETETPTSEPEAPTTETEPEAPKTEPEAPTTEPEALTTEAEAETEAPTTETEAATSDPAGEATEDAGTKDS